MYNGHYFGVPRVAVVDRFDCTVTRFVRPKEIIIWGNNHTVEAA
jgi:hypothetical protein